MGVLTDKAGAVAGAFNNFATALANAANRKRASAGTAGHAARLNGLLPSEIVNSVSTLVNGHINADEHDLTAAQVGAYTEAEMTDVIDGYPAISKMPFVSFGDATKVPIDVSGAFSGASDGATVDYALNLEDDGTLAILRNGTDGSKYRTYFAFVPDAATGGNTKFMMTTKEFRPTNLPSSFDVKYICCGNNVAFFGRLVNRTTNAEGDYVAFLPAGSFLTETMPYCRIAQSDWKSGHWIRAGVIVGQYLYYVTIPVTGGQSSLEIQLWRIPTAHFDGREVIPELVTGWATTTPRKAAVQEANVKVFDILYSVNINDNCMVHLDQSAGGSISTVNVFHNAPEVSLAAKDERYIRMRLGAHTYIAAAHVGQSVSSYMSFSLVFDLVNKTVIMDPGPTGPEVIKTNYWGDGRFNFSTEGYWKYSKYAILGNNAGNSPRDAAIQQRPGYQHCLVINGEFDSGRLYHRSKFLGSVDSTAFECLKYGVTVQNETGFGFDPVYGSATGSKFYGVIPFGDNKLFLAASGRNAAGNTQRSLARVVNDINVPNYQYKTLGGAVHPGYGPTTDRKFLTDIMPGETMLLYSHLVTEVDDDTGYTVHGSYFTNKGYVFGVGDLDADGNEVSPGKRVFIAPNIFEDIFTGMLAMNSISQAGISRYVVGVFFPKCLPRAYAYVQWMTEDTKNAYITLVELSIAAGTLDTTVTAINIHKTSNPVHLAAGNVNGVGWWWPEQCGGVTIYKVGTEGYAIGLTTKGYVGVVGGAGSHFIKFFVDSYNDKPPEVMAPWNGNECVKGWVYPYLASNIGFTAFKGKGFGHYSNIDNMTKLLFTPYHNTKAGIMAGTPSTFSMPTVIATQELAQGWDVYFTNPMKVMMNGSLVNVLATSINLKSVIADPSNKTFYIYLKWAAGVVTYDIVATEVTNRHDYVQIGTVTTGPTSITNITVNKLNLFGANSEH